MKPQSPCKDCPDRELGCHSKCQKYIDFRKAVDADNLIKDQKRREDLEIYSYMIQSMRRHNKR